MPAMSESTPAPVSAEPKKHRMDQPRLVWATRSRADSGVRQATLVVDVRGQEPVVVLGEDICQPGHEPGVVRTPWREVGRARPEITRGSERDNRGRQSLGDRLQDTIVSCASAVDLVYEDERRHVQPLQRPHQHAGLRLHAFDGRNDQDRPVEHAQYPFHLGDEVRMAGRVDQVDSDVRRSRTTTTADLIVMPRCCSSASESVCVVPASTLPISSMTPAA